MLTDFHPQAQAIAELNGLELDVPSFQFGVSNKDSTFLSKFPLGKVPAFEGADGFTLTEGAAISSYIAASGPKASQLLGADVKAKAKVAEWTLFTETELVGHMTPWLLVLIKIRPYDEAVHGFHASQFERALGKVEAAVQGGKKFLVGEELTLADLEVASVLHASSAFLFDVEMTKKAPATTEWLKGVLAVPEVAKYFSEFKPVEKRITGA